MSQKWRGRLACGQIFTRPHFKFPVEAPRRKLWSDHERTGAVAGAGALAFAASRDDKVGEVAKSGGEAVVKAANKAKEIDDKHIGAGAAYQVGRCSIAARP